MRYRQSSGFRVGHYIFRDKAVKAWAERAAEGQKLGQTIVVGHATTGLVRGTRSRSQHCHQYHMPERHASLVTMARCYISRSVQTIKATV